MHIVYMYMFFLGKVTALGVLCCFALFVCLTLLASFFLPSHLSFKNMYLLIILEYVVPTQAHCSTLTGNLFICGKFKIVFTLFPGS